ncbi:hypothetical protein F6A13_12125 [Acidithiobacillus sp. 'AMD consortium']|uniref:ParB N-terminal domain-containing protein n=1 Tax=Acidithiobacillus sp. 'AMD consortium' TaxID=2614801 RepID=UPI00124DAD5E|nr:ParB N-terminal domain-containing protein [Acidithiobacillus sp. 'AMD consortium']QFG79280.1 hypothetical protein F6A13_12125 [Acidithiobacillus sp. 'AMD consortium']
MMTTQESCTGTIPGTEAHEVQDHPIAMVPNKGVATIQVALWDRFAPIPECRDIMPLRLADRPEYLRLFDLIKTHGVTDPIKVTPLEDGRLGVLDGYLRVVAAEQLGLEVPYVIIPVESLYDATLKTAEFNFSHRQLTDYEKVWVIGNHYLQAKRMHGGDRKSGKQDQVLNLALDPGNQPDAAKTCERLAAIYGVGQATVRNYADAVTLMNSIVSALTLHLHMPEETIRLHFFNTNADPEANVELATVFAILRYLKAQGKFQEMDRWVSLAVQRWAKAVALSPDSLPSVSPANWVAATWHVLPDVIPMDDPQMVHDVEIITGSRSDGRGSASSMGSGRSPGSGISGGSARYVNVATAEATVIDTAALDYEDAYWTKVGERSRYFLENLAEFQRALGEVVDQHLPALMRMTREIYEELQDAPDHAESVKIDLRRPAWTSISRFYKELNRIKSVALTGSDRHRDSAVQWLTLFHQLGERCQEKMPRTTRDLF